VGPPNPFSFGGPVTGPAFTGRARELALLLAWVRGGVNVVVTSPRRYGKTSLLGRAEEDLAAGDPAAAVVGTNVLLCRDVDTLASRLAAGAYRIPGARWHRSTQAIVEFSKRLRLRPRISVDDEGRPVFAFGDLRPRDADLVIEDVYALLDAERGRRPAAVVLDEFQAITRHGAHLPDLLKGLADEHPGVSLVLAGSQQHLMEELVFSRRAPLYGMAERLALGPIPDAEMAAFLATAAATAGRPMDDGAALAVIGLAGPVPNDIQRLAWEAWNLATEDAISSDVVTSAFDEGIAHESNVFADRLAALTPAQARVLIGIAEGDGVPLFSARFARAAGLASGASVKRAVEALQSAELVARRDGRLGVVDPYFAAWLRRTQTRWSTSAR
jgi:uncharacterized protein